VNQTFISESHGSSVSNAHTVIPNIATRGSARTKYGELDHLKNDTTYSTTRVFN